MPVPLPTSKQFRDMIRGHADGATDHIEWILRLYHNKSLNTDLAARMRHLEDLISLCRQYKSGHGPSDPRYAAFIGLGMSAEKEKTNIRSANAKWGRAKQIFAPSTHNHGKSNTLQHHLQRGAPTQTGNYWLEGLDPMHRSWGHEGHGLFDQWMADVGTPLGFFDWLQSKKLAMNIPQVQYLAPDKRWRHMCVFRTDRFLYRHAHGSRGDGALTLERFSTRGMSTVHSGDNFAIWVCSPGGIFYTNTHVQSRFHHSSFLAGERVLAAGEWVVSAGKILLISHKTGHHAATTQNLFSAMKLLALRTDLSKTIVLSRDFVMQRDKYVSATDFMAHAGNVAACDTLKNAAGKTRVPVSEARTRCTQDLDWDM